MINDKLFKNFKLECGQHLLLSCKLYTIMIFFNQYRIAHYILINFSIYFTEQFICVIFSVSIILTLEYNQNLLKSTPIVFLSDYFLNTQIFIKIIKFVYLFMCIYLCIGI